MTIEHILSTPLKESLLQISAVAHDDQISEQKKAEKLVELAKPTLELLDEVIADVGGTRHLLLEQLKGVIESGNWAALPTPNDVQLTLDKINRITVALNNVQKNFMADATEIFRVLMEVMRDIALKSKFEQGKQHAQEMDAVKNSSAKRKDANEKQKWAELATSIAQGIGGLATLGGSAGSLWHAGSALNKAKDTTKSLIATSRQKNTLAEVNAGTTSKTSTSSPQHGTAAVATANAPSSPSGRMSSDGSGSLRKQTSDLKPEAHKNTSKQENGPRSLSDDSKSKLSQDEVSANSNELKNLDKNESSDDFLENLSENGLGDLTDDSSNDLPEIPKSLATPKKDSSESERVISDIHLAKGNAGQAMAGAFASMINSSGGIVSAIKKKEGSDDQAEADTEQVNKETAGKRYQGEGDSANSMREALKAAIGTMSAMEQTSASTGSLIARNSV